MLPGLLIDDIAGTDAGALVVIDSAVTETLDSISPYAANPYILTELGQIYLGDGTAPASPTNTAVYCVFTANSAGVVIPKGFLVGDGTYQYAVQNGGVTQSGLSTTPLYCLASLQGTWAVPSNSVTTLVTGAPTGITLSVTNPLPGTPSGAQETEGQFRARVLQAGLCTSTGMPNYLKTLLQAVPGVIANLVSVQNPNAGAWKIIVGGTGDAYAIGYAIYCALQDVSTLVGSTLGVSNVSNAAAAIVTTTLNHGFVTSNTVTIVGVQGLTGANGTWTVASVPTPTTFSIGLNSSSLPTYTGYGQVFPDNRNVSVTINEYPNSYTIPFVNPPVQTVTMVITWNTSSLNYVSAAGVSSLVQPAIASYINMLPVGAPINELEMTAVFQAAVLPVIPTVLLTRLVFSVVINGIATSPGSGTATIFGDVESSFSIAQSAITVTQG